MKKTKLKLKFGKETLKSLTHAQLADVVGGGEGAGRTNGCKLSSSARGSYA